MSDIVYVEGKSGDKMKFRRDGEVLLPTSCPGNRVDQIADFKLRDDDVLIAGWPRSGTHWSWEMVSIMANRKEETSTKNKNNHMFEFEPVTGLDDLPSPRILNTHLKLRLLPVDMKTKPIKVIYLLRNPRDACPSWYKCFIGHSEIECRGKFRNWLPVQLEGKFDWGSWFDHVRSWERDTESHANLKIHYLQYEKVLKDPLEEMRKVRDFLQHDIDESLIREIVEKCHIDRMREAKKQFEDNNGHLHYSKGKAGTWKSVHVFTLETRDVREDVQREDGWIQVRAPLQGTGRCSLTY